MDEYWYKMIQNSYLTGAKSIFFGMLWHQIQFVHRFITSFNKVFTDSYWHKTNTPFWSIEFVHLNRFKTNSLRLFRPDDDKQHITMGNVPFIYYPDDIGFLTNARLLPWRVVDWRKTHILTCRRMNSWWISEIVFY